MADWGQQISEMTNRRLLFWIGVGLFLSISPGVELWQEGTISWISFGAGMFVSIAVFSDAATETSPGKRVNNWWRRIGAPGRTVAIVMFAILVWGGIWLFDFALAPLQSASIGIFVGLVVKLSSVLTIRIIRRSQHVSRAR